MNKHIQEVMPGNWKRLACWFVDHDWRFRPIRDEVTGEAALRCARCRAFGLLSREATDALGVF
jgi:hypothetical protein